MNAPLDWSRATVLSLIEFEVSWERLGLGETPIQLDPPAAGRTREERRRIVEGVGRELYRRGLGDGHGPHLMLAEQLRLLADPELSLDVRFRADGLVAGLTSCRGTRCVLAVRHGAEIAVLALPAPSAASALVGLIGSVTPGPGRPVELPGALLDTARSLAPDDPERFVDELVRGGLARTDAAGLVRMCSGVRRRGQFGATATAPGGRRRRAPYVVGVHHTDEGAFRQIRRRAAQQDTVTVAPVDRAALLRELDELLTIVGSRAS